MPWYPPAPAQHAADVRTHQIVPSPAQERIIQSTATVVVAVSTLGGGKTWACIMGLLYHAFRCDVRLRAAIIRDTHTNILRTIVPAFEAFFLDSQTAHKWSHDYTKLHIAVGRGIDVDLLGIDDLASVADIQGGEWGLIWLEEPCPYTDSRTANAGLSEDLYNAALVRCTRQQGTKGRLQLSSNHPDEEHWFFRRCLQAPDGMIDPRAPLITKETIEIPPGENTHLKTESTQAAIAAYAQDPIGYARFVKGEAAMRYPGKPVTGRVFNAAIHVSPIALEPVEGLMSWVGWDSWGNPAAVLGQQWPDGRLWVLDECVEGADVRDLLHNHLNPLVQSPRWKAKSYGWRQIGDRTMRQPDQSRHAECAADAVEHEFDPGMGQTIPFELGPQTWPQVQLGVLHALQWMVRGQPAVLLDPSRCKRLIAALKGRWHYPTNRQGTVTQLTPQKDDACVDEQTEMLTFEGWKTFDRLRVDEQVYGFDLTTQSLKPSTLLDMHIYDSCEREYDVLHFVSRNFDMMVTPDHKCVARRRTTSRRKDGMASAKITPFELVYAKDLHTGHHLLSVPLVHWQNGGEERKGKDREFSDEFIRLCAWVMTDGTYTPTNGIMITQSRSHNPQYIEEIEHLRQAFPTSMFEKSDTYNFVREKVNWGYNIAIRREIAFLMKQLMPNKYPSGEFIRMMTTSQKRLFLYEAIKGDGDWGPEQKYLEKIERNRDFWTGANTPRICCGKKEEADAVQMIATLVGMRSQIRDGNDSETYAFPGKKWLVSLMRRGEVADVIALQKTEETVPLVWCPTTTTGTWIARRNGTVFVTGNSHVADAFANAVCVIAPWSALMQQSYLKRRVAPVRRHTRIVASSYVTQGGGGR